MTNKQNNYGIVYVLTNPAMPGLVKIGMTSRNNMYALTEVHIAHIKNYKFPPKQDKEK